MTLGQIGRKMQIGLTINNNFVTNRKLYFKCMLLMMQILNKKFQYVTLIYFCYNDIFKSIDRKKKIKAKCIYKINIDNCS